MEKRIQIGIKLPPSLVAEIDTYRQAQEFAPDRTELIERAILDWLSRRADGLASGLRRKRNTSDKNS